jgi:hypothetical protein
MGHANLGTASRPRAGISVENPFSGAARLEHRPKLPVTHGGNGEVRLRSEEVARRPRKKRADRAPRLRRERRVRSRADGDAIFGRANLAYVDCVKKCHDFCAANMASRRDCYSPDFNSILTDLHGSKLFARIDLRSLSVFELFAPFDWYSPCFLEA